MYFLHLQEKSHRKKVKRYSQKENKKVDVLQPNVVNVYNHFMGGVDRMDQNISTYMINLRSKKWWWPLFRFCVDVAVINTFKLYHLCQPDTGESKLDTLEFSEQLLKHIICNTVLICRRYHFLDQGHSRVNMCISVLQITGL